MTLTHLEHLDQHVALGRNQGGDTSKVLELKNYLDTVALPPPLQSTNYTAFPPAWNTMLGNDSVGNCTIAGAMHMISNWDDYANHKIPGFTTAEAIKVYSQYTGYVPGDPSTDQGAYLIDVLNKWKNTGMLGHKILGFTKVDPTDIQMVKIAIELFGGVYAGCLLPISAQAQTGPNLVWTGETGPDGDRGSWGGHCPPIVQYSVSDKRMGCFTWGMVQQMVFDPGQPDDFFGTYYDEVYAVVGPEWGNLKGQAPNGFLLDSLLLDLGAV